MTKSQIRLIFAIVAAALCVIALAAAFFGSSNILESISGALSPLISGLFIAFIINMPMRKIESFLNRRCLLKKKPIGKKNTAIALILAWFCAILLVIVVCGIVLPHLIAAITTVAEGISHAPEILKEILKELGIKSDSLNISSIFSKLGDVASNILGQLTAVLNGAVSFFTGAILSIYMLANKSRLKDQAVRMVTAYLPGKSKKICATAQLTYNTFTRFLTGQFTDATIVGLIYFMILSVCAYPYAESISLVNAVLTLIPYIGPLIGCVLGFILIAITDIAKAFIFIAIFLIVQLIEGQFIYPRVVGGSIGLPPMWTLIAALLGSRIGGFLGALIFIPGLSVVYNLVKADVNNKLKDREN